MESKIQASYATGRVSGAAGDGSGKPGIGGLVGTNAGTVEASYATARVSGTGSNVGGLVGANDSSHGVLTACYWDTTTSGYASGAQGRTTSLLQAPLDYNGLYATWNLDLNGDSSGDDPWDFGTATQYPVLSRDFNGDESVTWEEFGFQLREGPSLTVTTGAAEVTLAWTAVDVDHWTPAADVTYTVTRDDGTTITVIGEGLSGLTATDVTAPAGATYTYQVAAMVEGGEAARSDLVTANRPPAFEDTRTTRSVPENITGNIGAEVEATDPDEDVLTYSLSGPDALFFTIATATGQLQIETALDYETRSSYEVIVSVHDGTPDTTIDATIAVTITVTNVDEAGVVAFSMPSPQVGQPLTATLSDPDVVQSSTITWQWERSPDRTNWTVIDGETSKRYMPIANDANQYLRVTASYTDGHGPQQKKASQVTSLQVQMEPTVVRLEVVDERISEAGGTTTVTVWLSHASSFATVVSLTMTAGVGAVTLSQSTLTIPAEQRSGTVTLTAVDKPGDGPHREVIVSGQVVSTTPGARRPAEVRLTVTDDDPPEVAGEATVNVIEGDREVATYRAKGRANDEITWSLEGDDKALFDISDGVLSFKASPDYETSSDKRYQVTVQAADKSLPGERPGTLAVSVTVRDAPGTVRLSSTQPRVGSALTATVSDRDEVGTVSAWRWEQSLDADFPVDETTEITQPSTTNSASDTYTPVADDLGHYLRATVFYTDGARTPNKTAAGVTAAPVAVRRSPPPPPPGRGGGEAGRDDHADTAVQATQVSLDTSRTAVTSGQLNTATDVDYFTLAVPHAGVLVIETSGPTDTVGTVWQAEEELVMADSGGVRQNFRLSVRVAPGVVVIAVEGNGRQTGAYTLQATLLLGFLENPGSDSFQSGIGVLSGWVCAAEVVEIELNGVPQEAAYGTERLDTAGVCGDTDNGFGLLFNWNLLRDGEHEVMALVDGVELGRASVTVTTLGQEFLRDVTGTCAAEDFPTLGERVTLVWQQNSQNFVIAGGRSPGRGHYGPDERLDGISGESGA